MTKTIATTTATTRRRRRLGRRHPINMSVVLISVTDSRVHYLGYSILLYDKRGIEYRFQNPNDKDDRNDDRSDNDERMTTPHDERTTTPHRQQFYKSSLLQVRRTTRSQRRQQRQRRRQGRRHPNNMSVVRSRVGLIT
jgi:hypothetical protein